MIARSVVLFAFAALPSAGRRDEGRRSRHWGRALTDRRDVVIALLRATESADPEEVVRHLADDVVWQNVPTLLFACLKGLGRAAVTTARSRPQPVGR